MSREALETLRSKRRALKGAGWGDTPALDADIAAAEAILCEAIEATERANPADLGDVGGELRQNLTGCPELQGPQLTGALEVPVPAIPRKLTPERVAKIRELNKLAQAGLGSQRAIAAHFGISQSTVSDICSGKKWKVCPTVAWKPQLTLVDMTQAVSTMETEGGTFGSHATGVVTLPRPDDRISDAVDVDADEGAAQ